MDLVEVIGIKRCVFELSSQVGVAVFVKANIPVVHPDIGFDIDFGQGFAGDFIEDPYPAVFRGEFGIQSIRVVGLGFTFSTGFNFNHHIFTSVLFG